MQKKMLKSRKSKRCTETKILGRIEENFQKKNNEQMILPRKDDDRNFMTSTDEMEEKI